MMKRAFVSDRRKLSDLQVATIRATSTPLRQIARDLSVSLNAAWRVRQWFTYKLPRR